MAVPASVLLVELMLSADRVVTAARAASPAPPGAWDAATVLGHLSQVDDEVWAARVDLMVAARRSGETPPVLAWWEPDPEETARTWQGRSLDDAAAALMAARTRLVGRFRGMPADDWDATVIHDTFGELDVSGLLLRALEHDEVHRASLVLPPAVPEGGSPGAHEVG